MSSPKAIVYSLGICAIFNKYFIKYVEQFKIKIVLLIDPDEFQLLKTIRKYDFAGAYVHVKRRLNNSYDVVKILETHKIQIIGNHYITQLLIVSSKEVSLSFSLYNLMFFCSL